MEETNTCVDFRYGKIIFNKKDYYIGRSLQLYGEFSQGEADLFEQLVHPGDTVVEVGANIGSHTVHLAQLAGETGTLYAFEPQRLVFQILCGNMALNSITNAHCLQKCVGDASGTVKVPVLDPRIVQNWGGVSLLHTTEGEDVEKITLDSLGLTRCDLLKIDVEGMEEQVIHGAEKLINTCHPFIYTEVEDDDKKNQPLYRLLHHHGYRIYRHEPPLYNPNNYRHVEDDVFSMKRTLPDGTVAVTHIVSFNRLCVPQGVQVQGLVEVS